MATKREILEKYDVKELVRIGLAPCHIIRHMEIYDYLVSLGGGEHSIRMAADKYGMTTRNIRYIKEDMEKVVK